MKKKINLSRITIDLPEEDHKKFKAIAAMQGKSMREIVVEAIKNYLEKTNASQTSMNKAAIGNNPKGTL